MSEKFPVRSIVLAKVKGYPAWPAMVLDETLLPSNIQARKPKPKAKLKPKQPLESPQSPQSPQTPQTPPSQPQVVPIKFFSDDTYIWINQNDIKQLTKDEIAVHQATNSAKRRIDRVLERAFELAADPLDMEVFIKYGSNGIVEEEVVENDGDDDDEDKDEGEDGDEGEDESRESSSDIVVLPPKKKSRKSGTSTATNPKSKSKTTPKTKAIETKKSPSKKTQQQNAKREAAEKKKEEELRMLAEYDSDWGIDDFNQYNEDTGDYIYDFENQQESVMNKVPEAGSIGDEYDKAMAKFKKWQEVIVEELLALEDEDNEADYEALDKALGQFDSGYKNLPRSIVNKSMLLRALILSQRKQVESHKKNGGKLAGIKRHIGAILKKLGLEVRENTKEELEALNGDTDSTSKVSTPDPDSRGSTAAAAATAATASVDSADTTSPLKHEIVNGD
ncbi:uncharacterized protein LODBEIA_P58740 [Lodderomyces beijingensis]|uniref:PWWP domain-containing protein n=1 Tax=Lodderomyces beijingensis TaxID=1775926 RepID=A0ABP0ZU39_9ASCO